MSARRQQHIPELLEIHADELAYLWGRRRAGMSDTRHTLTSFIDLNDRIEAHVAGLLTVPSALPALLGERLQAADDRDEVFAAAYGLLRLRDPHVTGRIVGMFAAARGPHLLGLRDALGAAPLGDAGPSLQALLPVGEPVRAVAAATVLVQHGLLSPLDPDLTRLLLDDDPAIAAQAWQVLTQIDFRAAMTSESAPPPRPYRPALLRPGQAALRAAVFGWAVWTSQPWVLRELRRATADGDVAALHGLAAVGEPRDDALLLDAMATLLPPLQQPALLGRCGRPAAIAPLTVAMNGSDAALAAAAAEAYTRMTGEDVRGERVTPPLSDEADDFEREMAPPVWLPDRARVQRHLEAHQAALSAGMRWNRGHDIGSVPTPTLLSQVDLPARWDACARAASARRPLGRPPPLS